MTFAGKQNFCRWRLGCSGGCYWLLHLDGWLCLFTFAKFGYRCILFTCLAQTAVHTTRISQRY